MISKALSDVVWVNVYEIDLYAFEMSLNDPLS